MICVIISLGCAVMNKRKYKTNPEELLAKGRALAKQGGNDAAFLRRVETVNLVLSGHSATELSKNMGCHANTIIRWVKTADEQGFETLHDRKKPGRPSQLSVEQRKEIDCALQEESSRHQYNVWDGPAISDFIRRTYGINYTVRSCQLLARQLGFSSVRPQVFPSKGYEDTEKRDELKKTDGTPVRSKCRCRVTGRSAFSASDNSHKQARKTRKPSNGKIFSGKGQRVL